MPALRVIYTRSRTVGSVLIRAGAERWRPGLWGISPCQSYFNASSK